MSDLPPLPLPDGIRTRMIETATGLTHHVLEAGDENQPMLMLLHGFPELAFSWRKVMVPLAEAGFYVVAPDQRGYGRTIGWSDAYDGDLSAFSMPGLLRDIIALQRALGVKQAFGVIGHDFGSKVAAFAALIRPDIYPRLICMSAPFGGPPAISESYDPVHQHLLALDPPRRHYQWYYSTREAATDMLDSSQGLHAFLRAYFHMKSADWTQNNPRELAGWEASELATMPTYYIMNASENMAETVAPHDPGQGADWMSHEEMAVFASEFQRTGLQAALNWYRCGTEPHFTRDLSIYDGCQIKTPATFIAGAQDWGWAQVPGGLEKMATVTCSDWRGTHLVDNAGHWVQQEQPDAVVDHILAFLAQS